MAGTPPGRPIAPGIAGTTSGYPQWGVAGSVGDNNSWKIAEAHNEADKLKFARQGYLTWFTSQKAAQDFIDGQKTPILNGQVPNPLSGLAAIGAFFGALTQRNTWVRVLKVAFGGVLLVAGIVKMTGATDKLAGLGPVGMAASKLPGVS